MNDWFQLRQSSSDFAMKAEFFRNLSNFAESDYFYNRAAELEKQALVLIPVDKIKTRGIIGVSACSLFLKAGNFREAENMGYLLLSSSLPDFAVLQIRSILQSAWNESTKKGSDREFQRGEVICSISGPDILHGGAPMEIVLEKMRIIQRLFFRTVELLAGKAVRKGAVPNSVKEVCTPYAFTAPAGSYQFSVAVAGAVQGDFFEEGISTSAITQKFLQIVQAGASNDDQLMADVVPELSYQPVMRRITKSLIPPPLTGQKIVIYSPSYDESAVYESSDTIESKNKKDLSVKIMERERTFVGVLRALDLNNDWLELEGDNNALDKVHGLPDSIDDEIGTWVNRIVKVLAFKRGRQWMFSDIKQMD